MARHHVEESVAALFLGDAVISLLWPQDHMRLWRDFLPWAIWRDGVAWFEAHPTATRAVGLLEGVVAVRWLRRLQRR